MRQTYVGTTIEDARRDSERGVLSAFTYNNPFRGLQVFMNLGEEVTSDMKMDWDFLSQRHALVGSHDYVAEKVNELQELCGLEYLLLAYDHPWTPQKKTLKSLELFATKVMPQFKEKVAA